MLQQGRGPDACRNVTREQGAIPCGQGLVGGRQGPVTSRVRVPLERGSNRLQPAGLVNLAGPRANGAEAPEQPGAQRG